MRRLLLFVAVTLVVDTSAYAAITPLLPRLSHDYGLDKVHAGFLGAAYPAGNLLFALPAAWLVSAVGAKRTLICGLAVLAAASGGFAFAGSAPGLVAARMVQGAAAAAMWAGSLAWLLARAPRERRAELIGAAMGAAIGGTLFGPLLGAAADALGIEAVFVGFMLIPLAQIVWAARIPGAPSVPGLSIAAVRAALADPTMRLGMWLMTLPALGFGLLNVLVPLRLDTLGAGAAVIAGAFLAAIALEALVAPLAGRAADRRGRLSPARIGLGAGGVAVALLPFPRVVVLVVVLVMLAAPLLGMLWSPAMALLSDAAEARGLDVSLGFALSNIAWAVGAGVGAGGGGALAAAITDAAPFLLLAALAIGTAGLLLGRRAGDPVVAP